MTARQLWSERAGRPGPTLLLLHGLGATGAVWGPLVQHLQRDWPGSWIVCDLPGHGGSPAYPLYSFGGYAAAAAEVASQEQEVIAVGHSLGGMVALALGTHWYGVPVTHAITLGVKANWADQELQAARRRANRSVEWFESEELALQRFIRVAGLPENSTLASPLVSRAIRQEPEGYRLAMDPAASPTARAMVSPAIIISSMIGAARSSIRMACGDKDGGVTLGELQSFDEFAQEFPETGHSPHIERPAEVLQLILESTGIDTHS